MSLQRDELARLVIDGLNELRGQVAYIRERVDAQTQTCRQCHERVAALETRTDAVESSAGQAHGRIWLLARDLVMLIVAACGWLVAYRKG